MFKKVALVLFLLAVAVFSIRQINLNRQGLKPKAAPQIKQAYLLGDSIGEGLQLHGINQNFSNKGYRVVINAKVSRPLTGGNSTTSNGFAEVTKDRQIIGNSDAIIIELGTNPSPEFKANATRMVNELRNINGSAPIFWVNVGATRNTNFAPEYGVENCALKDLNQSGKIKLINWYGRIFSGRDPCNVTTGPADSPLLSSPTNVHPSPDGYEALASLIVNAVVTNEPRVTNTKAPTATRTPSRRPTNTPPPQVKNCFQLDKLQCDNRNDCQWFFCGAGAGDGKCANKDKTREQVCGSNPTATPIPQSVCTSLKTQPACERNPNCHWNDIRGCLRKTNQPSPTRTPTRRPTQTVSPTKVPTNGPSPTPDKTANDVKVALKLSFQGILNRPVDPEMKVKVSVFNARSNLRREKVVDFKFANGTWNGETIFNIPDGENYIVYTKGSKHIQKKLCDQKPVETQPGTYSCVNGSITLLQNRTNTLDFTGVKQLVGDLPEQDGVVDSYDISLIRNNIGNKDPETVKNADVNQDGILDTQDYSLLIQALSIKKDEK